MHTSPFAKHVPYSAEQAAVDRRQSAIDHRKNMRLPVSLLCVPALLMTVVSCTKVSWPALEASDEYFAPLMQSFSKFPFHDIYETAPLPSDLMVPGSRLLKIKPAMRGEWTRKTAKDLDDDDHHDERTCRLCDLLSTILGGSAGETRRNASKKRIRPAKLRKLMKHCRKN
nr:uncharacterized protein LOC109426209 [Aedes albopictus]